jgi:transcriptional regulator with XRE-family HTH domain
MLFLNQGGITMTLAERMKQLRVTRGLTQEQVGKVIGVSKATIMKYEKGEIKNLKRTSVQKLSEFFGVTPQYLLALTDEKEPTLDAMEEDLVNRFRALTNAQKIIVYKSVDRLLKQVEENV